jgi:hypothetical protein
LFRKSVEGESLAFSINGQQIYGRQSTSVPSFSATFAFSAVDFFDSRFRVDSRPILLLSAAISGNLRQCFFG